MTAVRRLVARVLCAHYAPLRGAVREFLLIGEHCSKFLSCLQQIRPMSSANSDYSDNVNVDDVLFESFDGARLITLNRPKALNALNLPMIHVRLRCSLYCSVCIVVALAHAFAKLRKRRRCAPGDDERRR